ncbi:hypothetical protein U0070_012480, partial [Myodes glareolus]
MRRTSLATLMRFPFTRDCTLPKILMFEQSKCKTMMATTMYRIIPAGDFKDCQQLIQAYSNPADLSFRDSGQTLVNLSKQHAGHMKTKIFPQKDGLVALRRKAAKAVAHELVLCHLVLKATLEAVDLNQLFTCCKIHCATDGLEYPFHRPNRHPYQSSPESWAFSRITKCERMKGSQLYNPRTNIPASETKRM